MRFRRYNTDPSGMYVRHEARAIGSGSEGAQSALEEGYRCSGAWPRLHERRQNAMHTACRAVFMASKMCRSEAQHGGVCLHSGGGLQ